MADKATKYADNATGKYYVDETCIFCNLCESLAPDNFRAVEDGTHDVCYKQPTSPDEDAACQEALAGCPVNAIGDDGDL
ncbi:MAG: ferredoxin [Candidatus Sericytochromatia bacterium]|nr:ferredoxin [Candidatus Sericytochromatia bacterium]